MNSKNTDIRMLNLGQISFILKSYSNHNKMAFSEGKRDSAHIRILRKMGWIIPAGKEDRKIRWELIKKFSKNDIDLMKHLIKHD